MYIQKVILKYFYYLIWHSNIYCFYGIKFIFFIIIFFSKWSIALALFIINCIIYFYRNFLIFFVDLLFFMKIIFFFFINDLYILVHYCTKLFSSYLIFFGVILHFVLCIILRNLNYFFSLIFSPFISLFFIYSYWFLGYFSLFYLYFLVRLNFKESFYRLIDHYLVFEYLYIYEIYPEVWRFLNRDKLFIFSDKTYKWLLELSKFLHMFLEEPWMKYSGLVLWLEKYLHKHVFKAEIFFWDLLYKFFEFMHNGRFELLSYFRPFYCFMYITFSCIILPIFSIIWWLWTHPIKVLVNVQYKYVITYFEVTFSYLVTLVALFLHMLNFFKGCYVYLFYNVIPEFKVAREFDLYSLRIGLRAASTGLTYEEALIHVYIRIQKHRWQVRRLKYFLLYIFRWIRWSIYRHIMIPIYLFVYIPLKFLITVILPFIIALIKKGRDAIVDAAVTGRESLSEYVLFWRDYFFKFLLYISGLHPVFKWDLLINKGPFFFREITLFDWIIRDFVIETDDTIFKYSRIIYYSLKLILLLFVPIYFILQLINVIWLVSLKTRNSPYFFEVYCFSFLSRALIFRVYVRYLFLKYFFKFHVVIWRNIFPNEY